MAQRQIAELLWPWPQRPYSWCRVVDETYR